MPPRPLTRSTVQPAPVAGACWIPLTQGRWALVDESDYPEVSRRSWCWSRAKYGEGYAKSNRVFLHHFLIGKVNGRKIDHANRNTLDNRRSNLRVATATESSRNTGKKGTRSKYKGVTLLPTGRWRAQITVDYRNLHLGVFDTQEEAAQAYDAAADKMFGDYAALNFGGKSC